MPQTISFADISSTKSSQSIYTRPQKKQRMSITQTYFLAHSARGKLSREAARPDHDLRLLVGHANMLDSLMIDLANAEQEQERWFNKTLSGAREEPEPIHHIETVTEEVEDEQETTDDESDFDEEDKTAFGTQSSIYEVDSDMEEDDEADSDLILTRTASRHSPPELTADADSDSEDDDAHMPPSPPTTSFISFTEKEREAIATTAFYDTKTTSIPSADFLLTSNQQPTIIAAY